MGSSKVRPPIPFKNKNQLTTLRMLLSGLAGIILVEIYAAVMQREFQNTDNRVGKGFAILGIYLFVVAYCASTSLIVSRLNSWLTVMATDGMLNSTTWLYGAEVLPIALRSKIMGLAAASHFIVNVAGTPPSSFHLSMAILISLVAVTEAGPSAFANIHENYYYVFVACTLFFLVIAYFYFP